MPVLDDPLGDPKEERVKELVHLVVTALLLAGSGVGAAGQQFTGGIRGSVRDATGVIPGVAVGLINEGTNASRQTFTNAVGEYAFPAVPPAIYTIRATIAGFKTFERRGLVIGTQEFLTLDLPLEVGDVAEAITVTADASVLERTNASQGADLDRETLDALPSRGRNAFLMAVTIPTVVALNQPHFDRQQDQSNASLISLGGGGIRANNYLLDGVPISELSGRSVVNPTIEALGDMKVQIHTYDAEMGRTGGGVFNATARSGSNQFHGSGFFQTRPVWGQSLDYFSDVAGLTKEDVDLDGSRWRGYGSGVGGPLVRNRTFFWMATEGYREQFVFQDEGLWPTARQKLGDFSTTTNGGSPVRIFNPFCRDGVASPQCPAAGPSGTLANPEFASAIIPDFALNPVARNMLDFWPLPSQGNEDTEDNAIGTGSGLDRGDMITIKIDHKLTDTWSASGFYLYNATDEPFAGLFQGATADALGGARTLRRRPHVFVFNNTNILNDSTVLTLRYGWTLWGENWNPGFFEGGPAALGFSPTYTSALDPDGQTLFPQLRFDNYQGVGQGANSVNRWHQPYSTNVALTKLVGNHTIKIGGDLRRLGLTTLSDNRMAGRFTFNDNFTQGPNGEGGYDLASLLVGAPSSGFVPFNRGHQEVFTRYYAAYIQDDWRASSKLTLNYGLRFEREDGLQEVNNRFTVAFDESAVNPLDALVPDSARVGTPLEGRTIMGGLVYAGVDGAPTHQGDPPAVKLSPRVGLTYALGDRTVVRGGYSLFWAPWNYSARQFGQVGFTRDTELIQGSDTREAPFVTLDNPFPNGLQTPIGSSLGLLTGAGGSIGFIDQTKGAGHVQQYSVDLQRELPGEMAVTIGYAGAAGDDIGYGGTTNAAININQIPSEQALAAAPAAGGGWDPTFLRRSIVNPFFGIPAAGEFSENPTILRGQLMRPFPQFGNVNKFQTTDGGKRRYHALIVKLTKRSTGWWGGRISYTLSNTEDNQFGQGSAFASRLSIPQDNYDLDAEYGTSIFDAPHNLVFAPIVRIPGPADTGSLAHALLGGWTASAIVRFVSGAPASAYLSGGTSERNLGLFGGRQRPNPTGEPLATPGSDFDRVASTDHPGARWFDAAAFENPGPGQFGTNPRTDTRDRHQFRKNLDLVFMKNVRAGSGLTAQVRFEVLNATNTPQFRGASNAINFSSFGRINGQRGHSRVWQFTFRLSF